MSLNTRSSRSACLCLARIAFACAASAILIAITAPAALAAFGVEEAAFEATTCMNSSCTYAKVRENPGEAFTQAAGHPPVGVTTFEFNHHESVLGKEPEGAVKNIRVDLPPGLAGNPEALPKCAIAAFEKDACAPDTQVGSNELTVFDGINNLTVTGTVYNLAQPPGVPLDFGIHAGAEPLTSVHIFLEGHVAWNGDYHEYFEINNIPREGEVLGAKVPLAVLRSKLIFNGRAGAGDFLTLPSVCSNVTTSYLEVRSWEGQVSHTQTHTPVGVAGCAAVPFKPSAEVQSETAQSDAPDGTSTVVKVPQHVGPEEINTADIRDAHVTLPEGLTLNPAAARGLQACTPAQIAVGSTSPVTCPPASLLGTVSIETDLPPGSLAGNVYLGNPGSGPITGPPFTIYLDAESVYGVSVRLQGKVEPNPATGRLEASFADNPQLPFSVLVLKLKGGAQAPLANPLACGSASVDALFTPYTGTAAAISSTPFVTSGCASPLPFTLAQSTQSSSPTAGAYTSYTFNLARAAGQQYLSQLQTILPPGLLGAIPSVPLCGEPQAGTGTCPAASRIGTATVSAGAGPEPYAFSGPVFLTGPYNGAPYGLSVAVPASAGPFDLGSGPCNCVLTRAAINVDPYTGRVIATSTLPRIVKGVPLRLRNISVVVDRPNFLFNPTNCGPLSTDSTLTSTFAATQGVSSPFQVGNCAALAFKPSFTVSTGAHPSKANGASLHVNLLQGAHEANIRSVFTQLPKQLSARLTTLQKACPEAAFAADPGNCPSGSRVGVATVATPVLPGMLSGTAYLVSHGGAAFPDLDLVLQDGGVRVILVGNTNITKGVTTSNFASIPDAPVSAFTLDLPTGPNSALAASSKSLCGQTLLMPTVITAQSGAQIKQSTRIAVLGCKTNARLRLRILSHRIVGHTLILKVRTPAAGRVRAGGKYLRTVTRRARKATTVTLRVKLSHSGVKALRRHHRLRIRVRVSLQPSKRSTSAASAAAAVTFRQ
ncbi:MAG TPA: hypothetical protein VGY76_04365 [Solirubrobacteraceae bacterium]|jgi:hypothetical protein|nr:hypothetical protein [Solirubrobacteraceae bacterium]